MGIGQVEVTAHATSREDIARLHTFERWPGHIMWPIMAALIVVSLTAIYAWNTSNYLLLISCWPLIGYLMFEFSLVFHDASHGRLHPVPWLNELVGHTLGSMGLVPLSVFRYAHSRHHTDLGTERDPELWPYTAPGISRAVRVAAGILEIGFGVIYLPLLFLRAVVISRLSPQERRGILRGYLMLGLTWGLNIAVIHRFGFWELFLVVAVVPMILNGMLNTLNKFTQHLGLHGRTVLGLTRTVVGRHWSMKMISKSLMYNDYHGTHHRYAKMPYYHLPPATPYTISTSREPCPVFSNVLSALFDMLPCLANPKVGPQWVSADSIEVRVSPDEVDRVP